MPVFVAALRLSMLFLNVYDSYKVLKLPPGSSRNNGRPSQRAMMQRKRNIKGCIAVWIVWCCFTIYERFAEGLVSLFVPFYDEVKSILVLFLIMTRARGAEPIFLHVIRPFLRPYTPTLDLLLDFFNMLGDMAFAAILGPLSTVRSFWGGSGTSSGDSSEIDDSGRESPGKTPVEVHSRSTSESVSQQRRVAPNNTLNRTRPSTSSLRSQMTLPRNVSSESTRSTTSNGQPRSYEIWHPSQAAHSDSEETLHDDSAPTEVTFLTEEAKEANEWKQYPAFPSAYPATPVFKERAKLPGKDISVPLPSLTGILEASTQKGFDESPLPDQEPESPTSDGMGEDILRSPGARGIFSEEEILVDSEDGEYEEEEEDVFNMTLKTPPPAQHRSLLPGQASNRSSIGSVLSNAGARNALKSHSSSASLDSTRSGADQLNAPGIKRRHSSNSSVDSGRSSIRSVQSRTRESIPRALRTGPMLKNSNTDAESDAEDKDDAQPPASPKRRKVTAKVSARPVQAAQPTQPKTARPTQPVKSALVRKPSRPPSDAFTRNSTSALASTATEKQTRPTTQRRNPPLTQATNRKENN